MKSLALSAHVQSCLMAIQKLSVLIPACNEEGNIPRFEGELFPELERLDIPYEVIVVDDGSRDKTLETLETLRARFPALRILSRKQNRGMGYSLREGILSATGDVLVTLDADLTFHPSEIPILVDRFLQGDVDCVIGSTYMGKAEADPLRMVLSRGLNLLYELVLGRRIRCISPIFKLYKTDQLKELDLTSDGFLINAEIVVKLLSRGRRFAEVPATLTQRIHGESKINTTQEMKNHILFLVKTLKWRLSR